MWCFSLQTYLLQETFLGGCPRYSAFCWEGRGGGVGRVQETQDRYMYSSPLLIGTPLLPNNPGLIREVSFCKKEHYTQSWYLLPRICVISKVLSGECHLRVIVGIIISLSGTWQSCTESGSMSLPSSPTPTHKKMHGLTTLWYHLSFGLSLLLHRSTG